MALQFKKQLGVAMISGAALMLAGAAQADSSYSMTVSSKDFQNTAKVAELHKRIRRTAAKACPSYFVSRGLAEVSKCRRDVEADLVSRINHPVLSAYVNGEEAVQVASLAEQASES